MRLVRLAIANVNTTVGALHANVDRAISRIQQAAADGASIVALPEQLISGYPPEDLVQWRSFVDAQWVELKRLASETQNLGIASVVGITVARDGGLYNCAALVLGGTIWGLVPKEKLPTYNVFYEGRTMSRGLPGVVDEVHGVPFGDLVFELDFGVVALEVCEDIWSPDGPMRRRCYAGAELIVNISSSPFRLGVQETRREMIATRAGDNQCTILYSNQVGANDGLVFDGGGFVAQNGRLLHTAPRFREQMSAVTIDLDRTRRLRTENSTWRTDQEVFLGDLPQIFRVKVGAPTAGRASLRYPAPSHRSFFLPHPETEHRPLPRVIFCEEILDTLELGIGDYFEKTGAFKTIGVALSGGRDSLICMLIARRYINRRYVELGPAGQDQKAREILRGFFMPTRFSSETTRRAAELTAQEVNAPFVSLSVDEAFESEVEAACKLLQPGEVLTALTKQNIQARLRSQRMWNWSNSAAGLFLQTSNMSEKAVGYCTIGGDMEGALSVVANLPKTVVNYLLDYLLETTGSAAIRATLEKPASAELADNQEDEKDLMPFPILDACFALFAGEKMSPPEVCLALRSIFPDIDSAKLDANVARFAKLFTTSIYKWVQTPLSLHVGNLDLDRERALQLPVVQSMQWQKGT